MERQRPSQISSIDQLINAGPGDFFRQYSLRGLIDALSVIKRKGDLPKVETTALEILQRGSIHAERYAEGALEILRLGDLDIDPFNYFSSLSFSTFGDHVGDQFVRSYLPLVKQGVEPEDLFEQIGVAVKEGGRLLGAVFTRVLPVILRNGGNIQDFLSSSIHVKKIGNFKIARKFMNEASRLVTSDRQSLSEITGSIIDLINSYGKDFAFWSMPGVLDLFAFSDYTLSQYLKDTNNIRALLEEKASNWFASGVSNLGRDFDQKNKAKKRTLETESLSFENLQFPFEDSVNIEGEIRGFKQDFIELYQLRRDMARFYARVAGVNSIERSAAKNILYQANLILPKRVLSKALWLIPQICMGHFRGNRGFNRNEAIEMLKDCVSLYLNEGEDKTMHTLYNTRVASNKNPDFDFALHIPKAEF